MASNSSSKINPRTIASAAAPVETHGAALGQKALANAPSTGARSAGDFEGPPALTHASDHPPDTAAASEVASPPVLVVDLDGTVLKSDLLYESLWSALSRDGLAAVRAALALLSGRAAMKAELARVARIDVATLPYDAEVCARVAQWRAEGGRTALVTASDQHLADAVAAHLGLFDEVHGSDGARNLKGPAKADFLIERFGRGGYVYVGDSPADLEAWKGASQAISVGAPAATRAQLDAGTVPAEHLMRARPTRAFLRAIRPQQWLKNLLVLVPLIADLSHGSGALPALLATIIALSLAASAGYLINDLLDLSDDRSHPRKCLRPFASGDLSTAVGTQAIPVLLLLSFGIAFLVSAALAATVAVYLVATLAYSVRFKRHTILDICLLAFLFTLRIIAGGVAIGSGMSVWLLAFSMFIFFALAAVKRLAELTDIEAAGRQNSRRGYLPEDRRLISQMAITSGYLAVLVLALYVDEPATQEKFSTPWLLWGVCPLLIFWISRMVLVADRGQMHDDPMEFSITNPTSRLVVLFCGLLVAGAALL